MTTKNETSVTRRDFLAAVGVGAAALAVPAGAVAAESGAGTGGRLPWLAEQARAAYVAEVEMLAERLRPRFESGELRGMRDEDLEDDHGALSPMWEVGQEAGEYFRLVKRGPPGSIRGGEFYEGAEQAAHLVLLASPSTPYVDNQGLYVAYEAQEAAMWDVILIARERGWYTPGPTECLGRDFDEDQELQAQRQGVRS